MSGALLVRAGGLPAAALDAMAGFMAEHAPIVRDSGAAEVVIVLDPADHSHARWRRAAVEELAREAAPHGRVNAIVTSDDAAPAAQELLLYLEKAPGVTGQVLEVADHDA